MQTNTSQKLCAVMDPNVDTVHEVSRITIGPQGNFTCYYHYYSVTADFQLPHLHCDTGGHC